MRWQWIFFAILLLTAGTLWYVYSGRVTPVFEKIEDVTVSNLDISDSMSLEVNLTLLFKNPNPITIHIERINCNIYLEDEYVTTVNEASKVEARPLSTFSLPVKTKIKLARLTKHANVSQLLLNQISGDGLKFRFDGTIEIHVWGWSQAVPFNQTYTQRLLF